MTSFEIKQNFKETALHTGIPSKQNGLITDDDVLYKQMCIDGKAFQKHVLIDDKAYLTTDCWCIGDDACTRGIDLRYALKDEYVIGVVQFGLKACIDQNRLKQIHGGAIHTVLDEITAETVKILCAPSCSTSDFSCSIKKPILPNQTYTLESKILSEKSPRIFTEAKMKLGKVVVAMAKATLVDLKALSILLNK